jgi:hypothetical protein
MLNSNEIRIQAWHQSRAKVLTRRGSHYVYNIIPKSKEWLTINYVENAIGGSLPTFYIFKCYRIKKDYIKHCRGGTMHGNAKENMDDFFFI